ncbi:nematocyst expressed protein 3-like [Schistocerca piceifrons]|uniref:nematocyst expressed protein 3-like n=1 Tax=Schistocerca piceifrons TaxID=274613 RepID=UPI001F5F1520|nr:nematocyst expressed protein 3-like [Schistocerca piceifrons]
MRAPPRLSHADEAGKRRGGQQPRRPLFAARRSRRGPSKISPLTPTVLSRPGELQDACSHRRRFQLPSAVANSFDALADAPEQLPRYPAPKKDSHLPPVVLQFRPPYGELQKSLRSWTTAVYTVSLPGVTWAPSAVPTASAAPAPAASEAVPTPEAPAPPPQLLVTEPGTASPEASAGPRPANRRLGGHRPVGTQRSAPSVEQLQVDSRSEAATPPPSNDGAAPAASTADLAILVAQLTALVTSAMKLIEVLSQQLTAAVPMAAPVPTAVNTHQLHRGQR